MVCAAFGGSLAAQRWLAEPLRSKQAPTQARRIVSMAPSITETLYALGLGDRVVGVSRDSRYPPQVESVKRSGDVGGYFDPNFEAILARKPDLVLMLEEQAGSLPAMAKLDLQTLLVCHKSIDGIIDSFGTIGRACGKGAEAERMQRDYRDRLATIHQRTRHLARPRVLIVLDRIYGSGHLADVYIAGHDDYFDKVIGLAGGQNAYRHGGIRYPVLSAEGILRLDPEVIVDLV
ncbi:MAG: helical backbone metal receptor, partial [Planctomycetaceae bacterium]|nr:helical backbone metal receptor [Planctomycetaceae bacterium]